MIETYQKLSHHKFIIVWRYFFVNFKFLILHWTRPRLRYHDCFSNAPACFSSRDFLVWKNLHFVYLLALPMIRLPFYWKKTNLPALYLSLFSEQRCIWSDCQFWWDATSPAFCLTLTQQHQTWSKKIQNKVMLFSITDSCNILTFYLPLVPW